jgi:hypothetical protein
MTTKAKTFAIMARLPMVNQIYRVTEFAAEFEYYSPFYSHSPMQIDLPTAYLGDAIGIIDNDQ